jgi:hypothetical protein
MIWYGDSAGEPIFTCKFIWLYPYYSVVNSHTSNKPLGRWFMGGVIIVFLFLA